MSEPPAATDVGGGPALVLRLVRSRGLPRVGAFSIPPEGSGVAGALQIGGARLSKAAIEDANRCVIARLGGQWVLCNESRALVCALNGQRVGSGKRPALFDGDVLELALLRFEVDAPPAPAHDAGEPEPPPWVWLATRGRSPPEAGADDAGPFASAQPPESTW